jgi:hypothetical protein
MARCRERAVLPHTLAFSEVNRGIAIGPTSAVRVAHPVSQPAARSVVSRHSNRKSCRDAPLNIAQSLGRNVGGVGNHWQNSDVKLYR